MTRLWSIVIFTLSALASWFVYLWGGHIMHVSMPMFMATVLILSVLTHELCHALILEMCGVRSYIVFAVIGGGTIPYAKDIPLYKKLPWDRAALVSINGMVGNFLMVICGLTCYLNRWITLEQLRYLINMNASLVIFNLLPFGIFDGGKFAHNLFDSITCKKGKRIALAIGITVILSWWTIRHFLPGGWQLTIPLLIWGLNERTVHSKYRHGNHQNMTEAESKGMAAIYVLMIVLAMFLESSSDHWKL